MRIEGKEYRLANPAEISEAQDVGSHVFLVCTMCEKTHWMCKGLAIANNGGYSGIRNIFYLGDTPECKCPSAMLRMVVPDQSHG